MTCIFCKIIRGEIPSIKVLETAHTLAFMDIQPIAKKHVLVIPKAHAQFLHQVPDENMQDLGVVLKRVALALQQSSAEQGAVAQQYNVLQNNGRMAHQEVDHVHFHIIPKDAEETGLRVGWPALPGVTKDNLVQWADEIKAKLPAL